MEEQAIKNDLIKRMLYVIIMVMIVVFCVRECENKRVLANRDEVNSAIMDSLRISKNALGQSTGTTTVISSESPEYFLSLRSKDSTIVKLQKLVEKYKNKIKKQGSIAIINSEGTVDLTVPTEIDNSNSENPTYNSRFSLLDSSGKSWGGGTVVSKPDSTSVKLVS